MSDPTPIYTELTAARLIASVDWDRAVSGRADEGGQG